MTVAYFTPRAWVKRVCCVSKISSNYGCQSKEIGVGMEVRLLSVGTRGFFLARRFATRNRRSILSPPTRKKPLAPGYPRSYAVEKSLYEGSATHCLYSWSGFCWRYFFLVRRGMTDGKARGRNERCYGDLRPLNDALARAFRCFIRFLCIRSHWDN